MQFEDPRSILEAAAAKPSRGIDPHALIGEGRRLRRARFAAATSGLAVVVVAASAAFGVFGSDRTLTPVPPVAPSDDGCREIVETIEVRSGKRGSPHVRAAKDAVRKRKRELRRLRDELTHGERAAENVSATPLRRMRKQITDVQEALAAAQAALQNELEKAAARARVVEDLRREMAEDLRRGQCAEEGEASKPSSETPAPRPRDVEAILRHAGCSLRPPDFVEPPAIGNDKWCTFDVDFVNRADRAVVLDESARLLLVDDTATLTLSTAYTEGRASPKVDDLRIEPEGTLRRTLYFAVDPLEEPTALVFGDGADAISLSFDYDCPADLSRLAGVRCNFTTGP